MAPRPPTSERVLDFYTGVPDSSMVLGLFSDNGLCYYPRMDFVLPDLGAVTDLRVEVTLRVGQEAGPQPDTGPLRAGVRVNGHEWQWQDLAPFRNGQSHRLTFSPPTDDWREGGNRVEVCSNAANHGNLTRRSVDIPCSLNPPAKARSYYSHDLRSWTPQEDRHWAIAVRYTALEPVAAPACLRIVGGPHRVRAGTPVRFVAVAETTGGQAYTPSGVEWRSEIPTTSAPVAGVFVPDTPGRYTVTAAADGLSATVGVVVTDATWTGILGPDSDRRLKPVVPEGHVDLCGLWSFRSDPENAGLTAAWHAAPWSGSQEESITVPGSVQAQKDIAYHGVTWYRRTFHVPESWTGREVWIRFAGVATETRVWVNGVEVGEHVGNWTPFRLRVTEALHTDGAGNTLTVRVSERPDWFSAGFPRVVGQLGGVDSHFGGIWQAVSLAATGPVQIQDVHLLPSLATSTVGVRASLGGSPGADTSVTCAILDPDGRVVAQDRRSFQTPGSQPGAESDRAELEFAMSVPSPQPWTPDTPWLYSARLDVSIDGRISETRTERFGMRDVERRGHQILLNGEPLFVRGVLHWGYYPELFSIDPAEETIRREFRDLKAAGFNLVKVCLFMFPKRFYEIADEVGMLVWQEYPVWQTVPAKGDSRLHAAITREYEEWIRFDRNHPCIILRDLTCEAHPGQVDLEFLNRTWDLAKRMTDGALVEANSAYMSPTRSDWEDIHFYRDVDEMIELLPALAERMRNAPEVRPYLSGEDMDFDTYRDLDAIRRRWQQPVPEHGQTAEPAPEGEPCGALPWWLDNANFRAQEAFEAELKQRLGPRAATRLVQSQNLRVLASRKRCFEEFRRYPELTGYAMTCIRDIPATRPGFYDDTDTLKWSPESWRRFNRDRVFCLVTAPASRCYTADQCARVELVLSNYGHALDGEQGEWKLWCGNRQVLAGGFEVTLQAGGIAVVAELDLDWHSLVDGPGPTVFRLAVALGKDRELARNDWSLWVFPAAPAPGVRALAYSPDGSAGLRDAFPGLELTAIDDRAGRWVDAVTGTPVALSDGTVLLTDALDAPVHRALADGVSLVYVTRDRPTGLDYLGLQVMQGDTSGDFSGTEALPRQDSPFWRELAIWLPPPSGTGPLGDFPHEGFVDMQFLPLSQRRPFVLGELHARVNPIVWGVNSRFPNARPVYDYVFEARAGQGRILACCLNVFGPGNTPGHYLLGRLLEHAAQAPDREVSGPDLLTLLRGREHD